MKSIADDIRKFFPHKHEELNEKIWLAELFDEHQRLIQILKDDVHIALTELQSHSEENRQFVRRSFARTLFAAIEGILNVLKQSILGCYKISVIDLTKEDFERLIEAKENFKGSLIKPKRIPLKDMMKSVYKIYSNKMLSQELVIDIDSSGWMAFCEGIKIRDRLMHPKMSGDLAVTEDEQNTLFTASHWFLDVIPILWKLPFNPQKPDTETEAA